MVMASGLGRRPSAADSPREVGSATRAGTSESSTLHDRLVAYVHALDNAHDGRSGVWVEHSYARAGLGGGCGEGAVRVLLAHREPPAPDRIDVDEPGPPPPEPPRIDADSSGSQSADEDEDEWEERLAALAPGAQHARLAEGVLAALRRVRLARLAGGRAAAAAARRGEARALRRALAGLWLGAGAGARPPQWLHAALQACAPRHVLRDYDRLVAELRRAAPRLADRLTTVRPVSTVSMQSAPVDVMTEVGPECGPWLVWVGGGRWARLLSTLVHTRRVATDSVAAAAPDAWCAATAAAARAAVHDILAEAGERPVVVGGSGGWASLAAALGGGARGLLCLHPPALTAEGEDTLARWSWSGPALVVAGGGAGGALAEALGPRQRLLLVAGADEQLRLSQRQQRRRNLHQRALQAHIVEECARWIHELCEGNDTDSEPAAKGAESEEEYAHLPAAHTAAHAAAHTAHTPHNTQAEPQRTIEIVEGRVVSRVSGGTPLALVPPRREPRPERRAEPRPERRAEPRAERRAERRARQEPLAVAAADIMHMPIVFADDDRTIDPLTGSAETTPTRVVSAGAGGAGGASAVTVRSGARAGGAGGAGGFKYTRVIVAKRGGSGARPLLLRRGLRLVPRTDYTD